MLQDSGEVRRTVASDWELGPRRFPIERWLIATVLCALLVAVAFLYFDLPVARLVAGMFGSTKALSTGLASDVLLGIEGSIALALVLQRIMRGRLSPFREATALACLTSICAYAINDNALKHLFGVPDPSVVLEGTRHVLNLFGGSRGSSFPSGHMVIAGAFAGVFMRLYRRSVLPLSSLLLVAAVLLILGDWHFISDVIAGSFVGVSAGLLAGEVWLVHRR